MAAIGTLCVFTACQGAFTWSIIPYLGSMSSMLPRKKGNLWTSGVHRADLMKVVTYGDSNGHRRVPKRSKLCIERKKLVYTICLPQILHNLWKQFRDLGKICVLHLELCVILPRILQANRIQIIKWCTMVQAMNTGEWLPHALDFSASTKEVQIKLWGGWSREKRQLNCMSWF